jgi:hypothetical protein
MGSWLQSREETGHQMIFNKRRLSLLQIVPEEVKMIESTWTKRLPHDRRVDALLRKALTHA